MLHKKIGEKVLDEAGKALVVQANQRQAMENQLADVSLALKDLDKLNDSNLDELDALLLQAENLCMQNGIDTAMITEADVIAGASIIELNEEELSQIKTPHFNMLEQVSLDDNLSWEAYFENVTKYAENNSIDLSKDPFETLMTASEKEEIATRIREDYTMKKAHCDKYDYMIAAFCGVAAGLIDSFFVGMPNIDGKPETSKLGKWSDDQANKFVDKFAKGVYSRDAKIRDKLIKSGLSGDKLKEAMKEAGLPDSMRKDKPSTLQQCIQYLENKYKVGYDARYAKDLNVTGDTLKNMRPLNHHIKSLAHSTDLIGLIFSIVDQFTGDATFVDNGKLIRVHPVTTGTGMELRGGNFIAKLFCGVSNWIGHIMSDLVGSNGTKSITNDHPQYTRGAGVPMPLYELFQFCNFGNFYIGGDKDSEGNTITLAELSVKVFEKGYDFRFAGAMAIPVLINELLIRLFWSLKSRFYHKNTWKESIPFGSHPELRRMLLIGHGTLCIVDGADAAVRSSKSGFNIIDFALHLNIVAWSRLALSGLIEIRALYKENALDIAAMDDDLEAEWKQLFEESNLNIIN